MPTYSYACTECGHAFDIYQSFSEDSLTECPQCQGRLRKVFGSVGVVFKGSGFYRTDSRAEKAGKTTSKPASESSSSSGSDSSASSSTSSAD
ncbi:MAG TPA: FmdB family zinc ribbon protein [Beutenbergiaceae bacterium]|nr:FmdB family zinc ribbon protein [Beutenbergiaceae bacterium]